VTFFVDGRRAAVDTHKPFGANLRFTRRATVRARVATAFDQLVTADRTVRGCS
jgi:hypothetical protein